MPEQTVIIATEHHLYQPKNTWKRNQGRLDRDLRSASKIEDQHLVQQQSEGEAPLIQVPWDDDRFSLCLDNFPNAKWAKNYYNHPTVKSPLRMHWKDDEEEEEEENTLSISAREKEETTSISFESASSISLSEGIQSDPSSTVDNTTSKKSKKKKKKSKLSQSFNNKDVNSNSSFPYNNDTNFLNRIEEENSVPIIKEVSKQRGRVEHVSPLLNNFALSDSLLNGYSIPLSVKKAPSTSSSVRSKRPSVSSLPSQMKSSFNGSVNGQSTISETETTESWKMTHSPTTGLQSPIVLPGRRQQYNPTPSHEYYSFQEVPSRSGTVTPSTIHGSGAMTPLQQPLYYSHSVHSNYSNSYYAHPSPSASYGSQASSYRSVRVPKNADDLVYFSNTPSIYSTDVGSEYTEKSRSYSQYFNPGYHVANYKKRNGTKRSNSLLSRLMRNIKHHFVKQQPQEL